MSPALPKAPPGYDAPEWVDDENIQVFIVTTALPATHPIDQLANRLARDLQALGNTPTLRLTTHSITYEEDLPAHGYAVVTNEDAYAEWCRSWGGNCVELDSVGDSLIVRHRDLEQSFGLDDLHRASAWAFNAARNPFDEEGQDAGEEGRDTGLALLGPISIEEFAGTEAILAELWRAIASDELDDAQRAQIQAMAELLKAQRMEVIPGETERWKLVGVLRSILLYLIKELPHDALPWQRLAELLSNMSWFTLAGMLPV